MAQTSWLDEFPVEEETDKNWLSDFPIADDQSSGPVATRSNPADGVAWPTEKTRQTYGLDPGQYNQSNAYLRSIGEYYGSGNDKKITTGPVSHLDRNGNETGSPDADKLASSDMLDPAGALARTYSPKAIDWEPSGKARKADKGWLSDFPIAGKAPAAPSPDITKFGSFTDSEGNVYPTASNLPPLGEFAQRGGRSLDRALLGIATGAPGLIGSGFDALTDKSPLDDLSQAQLSDMRPAAQQALDAALQDNASSQRAPLGAGAQYNKSQVEVAKARDLLAAIDSASGQKDTSLLANALGGAGDVGGELRQAADKRSREILAGYKVDPNRDTDPLIRGWEQLTSSAPIAASGGLLGAGAIGAAQSYGETYSELKAHGKSDAEAKLEALKAAARSTLMLPVYATTGGVSGAMERALVPETALPITKALAHGAFNAPANMGASSFIRALSGGAGGDIGESIAPDLGFALMGMGKTLQHARAPFRSPLPPDAMAALDRVQTAPEPAQPAGEAPVTPQAAPDASTLPTQGAGAAYSDYQKQQADVKQAFTPQAAPDASAPLPSRIKAFMDRESPVIVLNPGENAGKRELTLESETLPDGRRVLYNGDYTSKEEAIAAAGTGEATPKTVPEAPATIAAQLEQLTNGQRPAVMIPGEGEVPQQPPGMRRVTTPNGTFIFNPELTTAAKIRELDAAGRQNEILNLGPQSKAEAIGAGQNPVTVTERTPEGTEVRAAVASPDQAAATQAEMETQKTPGNVMGVEQPAETLARRTATTDLDMPSAKAQSASHDETTLPPDQRRIEETRSEDTGAQRLPDGDTAAAGDGSRPGDVSDLAAERSGLRGETGDRPDGLARNRERGSVAMPHIEAMVDFGGKVYRAGMDFARWSAEMVRHLGETSRAYLRDVWDRIKSSNDTGSVGGGKGSSQAERFAEGDKIRSEALAAQGADLRAKIEAYHGTFHDVLNSPEGRFSLHRIGTGEGNQSYAWGLYFAGKKRIAEYYRDALAKRYGKGDGNLYRVELTGHPDHFLAWDKDLAQQSPYVRKILERMGYTTDVGDPASTVLGERVYEHIAEREAWTHWDSEDPSPNNMAAASKRLNSEGIPGVKYLDASVRNSKDGDSHNYVMFDDSRINITHVNDVPIEELAAKVRDRLDNNKGGVLIPDRADITDLGQRIYKAGMDFKTWASEMLAHAGEKVKSYLLDTWQRVKNNEGGGIGGQPNSGRDERMRQGDAIRESVESAHASPERPDLRARIAAQRPEFDTSAQRPSVEPEIVNESDSAAKAKADMARYTKEQNGPAAKLARGADAVKRTVADVFSMMSGKDLPEDSPIKATQDFIRNRPIKQFISADRNQADNMPGLVGRKAANAIKLRIPNAIDDAAMPFVMESASAHDLQGQLEQFQQSAKDSKILRQYQPIIEHAIRDWERLNGLRGTADALHAEELRQEQAAGVGTREKKDYIMRAMDAPDDHTGQPQTMFGDPGKNGRTKYFTKAREYDRLMEAMSDGFAPKSTKMSELVGKRLEWGQKLVQDEAFNEKLQSLKASDGRSIINPPAKVDRETGMISHEKTPGYTDVDMGNGNVLPVHNDFVGLVKAFREVSAVRNNVAGRAWLTGKAFVKHGILLGDSFHVGRVLLTEAASGGMRWGDALSLGLKAHNKGLSYLEYSPHDLALAVKQGMVDPADAAWANKKRPIIDSLIKNGLPVGAVADNLSGILKLSENGLRQKSNNWIFQKLSRGALVNTAVAFAERNIKAGMPLDKATREAARDAGRVYSNQGNMAMIKSKTFHDLTQLLMLAPRWVFGQVAKEARTYGQLALVGPRVAYKGARALGAPEDGRGIGGAMARSLSAPPIGNHAMTGLKGVAGMFVMMQAINLATRQKFTWQNDEEGRSLDAFIPGLGQHGGWLSPFSTVFEYTHQMANAMHRNNNNVIKSAGQVASYKLDPLMRAGQTFATQKDYAGRDLGGTGPSTIEAAKQVLPIPIPAGAFMEKKQGQLPRPTWKPGEIAKQAVSSVGLKADLEPSATSKMFSYANDDKGGSRQAVEQPQYAGLRQALEANDKEAASGELARLLGQKASGKTMGSGVVVGSKDAETALKKMIDPAMNVKADANGQLTVKPQKFTGGSQEMEQAFLNNLSAQRQVVLAQAIKENQDRAKLYQQVRQDALRNALKPSKN